jgi:outer membrane protein assembly factor BamB
VKKALIAAAAVVLVAVAAGGAFVAIRLHQGRNIEGSSSVEFSTALEPTTTTVATTPHAAVQNVQWPQYGYSEERIRLAPWNLRPPFRGIWLHRAGSLVEFPPAVGFKRLYYATNAGVFQAINARTGKLAWSVAAHRCVAASPALTDFGLVIEAYLNRPPCNASGSGLDGEVVAYAAGFGEVRWRRKVGPSETSPLVVGPRVYVGDWNGDLWALRTTTGRVLWKTHLGGKLKGGAALSGNRLFIGSYDGHMSCVNARTGKVIWRTASQPRLGSNGEFYATPAVAYGRVYAGATDGKVYSFGAASGKLRWSRSIGGYVYASAAVADAKVFVGSYGGDFYALDAATGDVKWQFHANGPISGSATVLGGLVYFATLERRTYALDVRTGRQVWTFPDGKYSPLVSDGKRVYLIGYTHLYGMIPRHG